MLRPPTGIKTIEAINSYLQDIYREIVNKVNDPAFLAFLSSSASNVTGDGTAYTVVFDTEIFDKGSNFNTSTGIFTASVNGIYHFDVNIVTSGFTSNNVDGYIILTTSNRSYYSSEINPYVSAGSYCTFSLSVDADMEANDTAYARILVNATDKGVDILGHATNIDTYFSGHLVKQT